MKVHFGEDLVVIAQEKAKTPTFGVWTGSHWDFASGGQRRWPSRSGSATGSP